MDMRASLNRLRRKQRAETKAQLALLGNASGQIYVQGEPELVWVRLEAGSDANGNTIYGGATQVKAGTRASYPIVANGRVWVGADYRGEFSVLEADSSYLAQVGLNPTITNKLAPEQQWVSLQSMTIGLSLPVGSTGTPSTLVNAHPILYVDYDYNLQLFEGTQTPAAMLDLSSFIPTAGNQCVVLVALDTLTNTLIATATTPVTIDTPLVPLIALNTCLGQMFNDVIPLQSLKLANAQTFIDARSLYVDPRQFLNVPPAYGFASPVVRKTRIQAGRQVVLYNELIVDSELVNDGEIVVL